MRYENVCIEGVDYVLSDKVVTSGWIEEQLDPVYQALNIDRGFIELHTGIKERRWWDDDFMPSDGASMAADKLLGSRSLPKSQVQVVVNTSLTKDYMEPATAAIIHHKIGLSSCAASFDVTNACLGFLNGMIIVANMIELQQIDTGLVVAAENFAPLCKATIDKLRGEPPSLRSFRENFVALTTGSGAVAMLLRHKSKSANGSKLVGGYGHSDTQHHALCVAQPNYVTARMTELLRAGIKTLALTAEGFWKELGWDLGMINKVFSHQVAEKHRLLALQALGVPPDLDYPVLYNLGNIGPVSAPISLALAMEVGVVNHGDRICLVGVGSGVSGLILGIEL